MRKHPTQRLLTGDLADKLDGLGEATGTSAAPASAAADDALRALVSLGYSSADAERGIRAALDGGAPSKSAAELVRALQAKALDVHVVMTDAATRFVQPL